MARRSLPGRRRVFFVVTLIAAVCYMVRKNQIRARAEQAAKEAARSAKSAAQNMLADPMLLAAGLQVVRAIGVKKLIPILAIGGLALGFLMSRGASETSDEAEAGSAGGVGAVRRPSANAWRTHNPKSSSSAKAGDPSTPRLYRLDHGVSGILDHARNCAWRDDS